MKSPVLIAAVAVIATASAQAADYRAGGLEAAQPWSRPAVAGTNGIGYMVLTNRGRAADALTGVESPVAAKVEMHQTSMAGGVMSMQRQDKVVIPAGGSATFGPGAYHLMLMGLTRTTKVGDQIPATLTFASGAHMKVAFMVGMGAMPAPMAHMIH
jgi:copper(I)-binding protein